MKTKILFFTLTSILFSATLFSQFLNNFEMEYDLSVQADSSNINNIWTIGSPEKEIFDSANSEPNSIFTDSLNAYHTNDSSSFIVRMPFYNHFNTFPYFIFNWNQKLDVEESQDGGVVEVSYDFGQEWINIHKDTSINPILLTSTEIDTLFNGDVGFSKTNPDWEEVGYCWSYSSVYSNVDFLFLRFTFYSDSLDTKQEGWMMDDFRGYFTIVDATEDLTKNSFAGFKFNLIQIELTPF